jgi:hypothetical protein
MQTTGYAALAKACRKTLGSTPGLTRAGYLTGWRFLQFCSAAHGSTPTRAPASVAVNSPKFFRVGQDFP